MKLSPQSSKAISILGDICAIQAVYAIRTKNSSLVTRSITQRLLLAIIFSHILRSCRTKRISTTRKSWKVSRTSSCINGAIPVKGNWRNSVILQLGYVSSLKRSRFHFRSSGLIHNFNRTVQLWSVIFPVNRFSLIGRMQWASDCTCFLDKLGLVPENGRRRPISRRVPPLSRPAPSPTWQWAPVPVWLLTWPLAHRSVARASTPPVQKAPVKNPNSRNY